MKSFSVNIQQKSINITLKNIYKKWKMEKAKCQILNFGIRKAKYLGKIRTTNSKKGLQRKSGDRPFCHQEYVHRNILKKTRKRKISAEYENVQNLKMKPGSEL